MDSAFHSTFPYRIGGGSLGIQDPTYIERFADREIYEKLINREYCYVLNSRQMGKSSLRVQTMYKLEQAGICCAYIDLSGIGEKNTIPERWYRDLIEALARGFRLQINRRTWWRENNDLSLKWRLKKFIEDVILKEIQQNIVIFIDEIDSVLRFEFSTDDFFTLIRSFCNNRATHPEYQRLTFTLLGVAKPHDLIQDKRLPPFNVGYAIELRGFKLSECTVLAQGFLGKADHPRQVLKEVLAWTGGQPFLTQKLCWIVATFAPYITASCEKQRVEELVRSRVIENWESHDDPTHLKSIRDRLLDNPQQIQVLLNLYYKILQRGEVTARDCPEEIDLQLSGLIVKKNNKLKVYNRIYQSIFNGHWINQQLENLPQFYPHLSLWTVSAVSVIISILVMGMRSLGILQPLELAAFDQQMQRRPSEPPDERLLIVTVTDNDIKQLGDKYPISDELMLRLLKKLNQANPIAIGIDIYRDRPEGKGQKDFIQYLQHNPHIFPICVYPTNNLSGIQPPPELSHAQIGFINAVKDSPNTIRRHLLAARSNDSSLCAADYALSSLLAIHYLDAKGYSLQFPTNHSDRWHFGSVGFEVLKPHRGFYQNTRDLAGHQILLNYRATPSFAEIAKQVTMTEILRDRVDPAFIQNKIVLLGVTDSTLAKDEFNTPYHREIRGLILQAHMVSQLISFVENRRILLWFLPLFLDISVVTFCSSMSGVFAWQLRSFYLNVILLGFSLILLGTLSLILLVVQGLLLPLIPSGLAVGSTWAIIFGFKSIKTFRKINQ